MMVRWGVPDRAVTIAILTLGKGRVQITKKKFGGVSGVVGLPEGLVGPKKGKIEAYKNNYENLFFKFKFFFKKSQKV